MKITFYPSFEEYFELQNQKEVWETIHAIFSK